MSRHPRFSRRPPSSKLHATAIATLVALALPLGGAPAARAASTHEGFMTAEQVFDWDRDQASSGSQRPNGGNSWYGPGRDDNVAGCAIGTFRGQNSGNGTEETITIRPDGSAELRTRDNAPKYGTFAGETLTIGNRMSRVQPARGGIVVDGAYYYR